MTLELTPSQTVGPFFHDALLRPDAIDAGASAGPRVRIVGTVSDGAGDGVPDAVIEAWQGSVFTRVGTTAGGRYEFTTIRPSSVAHARASDAPHIDLVVLARGLLNQLVTRIYFPDEVRNATDPVLARVPRERRATLVAQCLDALVDDAVPSFRFDVVLQGRDETVFFDVR